MTDEKKRLHLAVEALGKLEAAPIGLIVVGRDSTGPFEQRIAELRLERKIKFCAPSEDVMAFYAADDA